MKSQLFIPNKIKVGFNLRGDTYNGKLAYIIGFDGKKWRKEPSWESWGLHYKDSPELEQKKLEQFNENVERQTTYYNNMVEAIEKTQQDIMKTIIIGNILKMV